MFDKTYYIAQLIKQFINLKKKELVNSLTCVLNSVIC